MPSFASGRHEHGQNFLRDPETIARIVDLIAATSGPIVEIGAGDGALTLPLQTLRRPITAVEIDARLVHRLRSRVNGRTRIVHGDFLHHHPPRTPHVVVGNLPFHQTTAMLRQILHARHWTDAVLLVQWEVARRRAGVGGATLMTAQWWPWYDFTVIARVPSAAFTPRPGVDAGLLTITRRPTALIEQGARRRYAAFVHRVFTGRGHGLAAILHRATGAPARTEVKRWLAAQGFRGVALPRDLSARQWCELFEIVDRYSAG